MIGVTVNAVASRKIDTGLVAVNPPHMLGGLLIGLTVSVLASLIPAAKASGLDPVESLRHE